MKNNKYNGLPTTIIIFGASGDLTRRKLIPSLFNLFRKRRTPKKLTIVGYGGTVFSDEQFCEHLLKGLIQHATFEYTAEEWKIFSSNLHYICGKYTDFTDFTRLSETLKTLEGADSNRLYYMALPPSLFPNIIDLLGKSNQIQESDEAWRQIILEKPFGTDYDSARELNKHLHQVLNERQIYRIDHYLGKETVQNILFSRFANTIFEPLWNRNYIHHVEITVAEKVGLEHRAGYYDGVGVLRDMFQNHLLQLMALVAMEPPASFNADALRNEKVKVLSAIKPFTSREIAENTIRAQYKSYLDESEVRRGSTTATYAALRLFINNWRWQGVPFYLRSGKFLCEKQSQIIIQFKDPPLNMFPMPIGKKMTSNLLVLYLQPDEGIHLRFEAKAPDTIAETRSVNMEFHYAEEFGKTAIPEAYERLLLDALQGDASLFTRADEVEMAWGIIDPILKEWETNLKFPLAYYESGSWGPKEADKLPAQDGTKWLDEDSRHILET